MSCAPPFSTSQQEPPRPPTYFTLVPSVLPRLLPASTIVGLQPSKPILPYSFCNLDLRTLQAIPSTRPFKTSLQSKV